MLPAQPPRLTPQFIPQQATSGAIYPTQPMRTDFYPAKNSVPAYPQAASSLDWYPSVLTPATLLPAAKAPSALVSSNGPLPSYASSHPLPAALQQPEARQAFPQTFKEKEKEALKGRQGIWIGAKNGFLFSLVAALPIWAVEKYAQQAEFKKNGKFQGNFFQSLIATQEAALRPENMIWTKALQKPIPTFLSSVAGTALIGISAGLALGPWLVSHTANRFEEVKKAKEEAQQGIFQPKPPTLKQRLKLAKAPITNPNQAYQELLDKELNGQRAFKEGAAAVLVLKMLPALVPITAVLSLCSIRNRWLGKKIPTKVWESVDKFRLMEHLKLMIQPVFLVKTAALPIMGGFIAQQTVPWLREQLGVQRQQGG